MKRSFIGVGLGVAVALLALAWWRGFLSSEPVCRDCNVLLISIDTLRADHLGCYGYARDVSPNIDAFRADTVLFETAIAHAPSTLPSHASLFTSWVPSRHGALYGKRTGLDPAAVTLAEALAQGGYRTAAFHGGGQMSAEFGLDRGFESYEQVGGSFADTVDSAAAWIERHADQKFFLFLHTYEIHHPYEPRPDLLALVSDDYSGSLPASISIELLQEINAGRRQIDEADLRHIVSTYDAEIRSMDEAFGRLVEYLKEAGLYDRTVIVFTSDHGEEFGEHGLVGWHGATLYDELLRVPLLIKLGGQAAAGGAVTSQVRLMDVAPSILASVGLPPVPQFEGDDLTPLVRGAEVVAPVAISQLDGNVPELPTSARTDDWKLWGRMLFDLRLDPGEQHPITVGRDEIRTSLREAVAAALQSAGERRERVELDDATRQRLRALGYLD